MEGPAAEGLDHEAVLATEVVAFPSRPGVGAAEPAFGQETTS